MSAAAATHTTPTPTDTFRPNFRKEAATADLLFLLSSAKTAAATSGIHIAAQYEHYALIETYKAARQP